MGYIVWKSMCGSPLNAAYTSASSSLYPYILIFLCMYILYSNIICIYTLYSYILISPSPYTGASISHLWTASKNHTGFIFSELYWVPSSTATDGVLTSDNALNNVIARISAGGSTVIGYGRQGSGFVGVHQGSSVTSSDYQVTWPYHFEINITITFVTLCNTGRCNITIKYDYEKWLKWTKTRK